MYRPYLHHLTFNINKNDIFSRHNLLASGASSRKSRSSTRWRKVLGPPRGRELPRYWRCIRMRKVIGRGMNVSRNTVTRRMTRIERHAALSDGTCHRPWYMSSSTLTSPSPRLTSTFAWHLLLASRNTEQNGVESVVCWYGLGRLQHPDSTLCGDTSRIVVLYQADTS